MLPLFNPEVFLFFLSSLFYSFLHLSRVRNVTNTPICLRWRISWCVLTLSPLYRGTGQRKSAESPEALTWTFGFTHTTPPENMSGGSRSWVYVWQQLISLHRWTSSEVVYFPSTPPLLWFTESRQRSQDHAAYIITLLVAVWLSTYTRSLLSLASSHTTWNHTPLSISARQTTARCSNQGSGNRAWLKMEGNLNHTIPLSLNSREWEHNWRSVLALQPALHAGSRR